MGLKSPSDGCWMADTGQHYDEPLHEKKEGRPVIHQVVQAGFPEEPPKNEQAMLIHAECSDSAGPEKAPFPVFPLL
jgi:hypothetical protein